MKEKFIYNYFIKIIIFLKVIFFITLNLYAENNYYNSNFDKDDLKNLKKKWVFKSNIYKTTQTRPTQYKDKIIFLDGYKNLRVINLHTGKEICTNFGKKDRGPHRGLALYVKSDNEVYAFFPRHNKIKKINILNCIEKRFKFKIKKPVSAPILIQKNLGYILYNGAPPVAFNLDNGKIIWTGKVLQKTKINLRKYNLYKPLKWDVWGGGVLDLKYNQLIISTANAKPTWVSKKREGPNLFYNSVVSLDLSTGHYKWHFQEIEHDLLNLDLAAPPILLNLPDKDYVVQATKTGQLMLLNRKSGEPTEKIIEKKYYHSAKKNDYTLKRFFPHWLTYSRNNFLSSDINTISKEFSLEANNKIKNSYISEYKKLDNKKNYIYYGIHGGTQWPGIASTPEGLVIVPSNNIAYRMKLKNPDDFKLKKEIFDLFDSIISINFSNFSKFKSSIKEILNRKNKIINFKKPKEERWEKFVNSNGIPLNSPPWGILAAVDIKNKVKKWVIPHGSYKILKNRADTYGAEVFGSPVILSSGIIFMAGTDDKKIKAYSLETGNKIWEDSLPHSSYGSLVIAEYENRQYLIVNSSSGTNFESQPGDAVVAYELKIK